MVVQNSCGVVTNLKSLCTCTKVNDEKFLVVNLYSPNTESKQIKTLDTLKNLLKDIDSISDTKIILGENLNLVFNCNLEVCGGNPVLKQKSPTIFIEIKESINLCKIWRVRSPNFKWYIFRQNHSSGFIQRRFQSNFLQERVERTDILASFTTNHSPILFSLNQISEFFHGKYLRKFNKSLLLNKEYVQKIAEHILLTIKM